jgi:hypothetical protein
MAGLDIFDDVSERSCLLFSRVLAFAFKAAIPAGCLLCSGRV